MDDWINWTKLNQTKLKYVYFTYNSVNTTTKDNSFVLFWLDWVILRLWLEPCVHKVTARILGCFPTINGKAFTPTGCERYTQTEGQPPMHTTKQSPTARNLLRQEVHSLRKHKIVAEHNECKIIHTHPLPRKQHRRKQPHMNYQDCSKNLGLNYSIRMTNGISS